jgi:hypothetical protein
MSVASVYEIYGILQAIECATRLENSLAGSVFLDIRAEDYGHLSDPTKRSDQPNGSKP